MLNGVCIDASTRNSHGIEHATKGNTETVTLMSSTYNSTTMGTMDTNSVFPNADYFQTFTSKYFLLNQSENQDISIANRNVSQQFINSIKIITMIIFSILISDCCWMFRSRRNNIQNN